MTYTHHNCPPGSVTIDADAGMKIERVKKIDMNRRSVTVFCKPTRLGSSGDIATEEIMFNHINTEYVGETGTMRFTCIGRIDRHDYPSLERCAEKFTHAAVFGAAPEFERSDASHCSKEWARVSGNAAAPCRASFAQIAASTERRLSAALRDDIATAAHYMGLEATKKATQPDSKQPTVKPAILGLCMVAGDRYSGRLTED